MIGRALATVARAGEAILAAAPALPPEFKQGMTLKQTDHRTWPLPSRPWLMAQTWRDLLFAHWPLAPGLVRPLVPSCLPVDVFEGHAWIGITPFELSGLRPRGSPPPPVVSRFPELNVRTYTTLDGMPGIYFFSLDAGSATAVRAARRFYRLPYFRAQMAIRRSADRIQYASERAGRGKASAAVFEAEYGPLGDPYRAGPGSLEYFLSERYCLYTTNKRGAPLRAEIQHPPWPLQAAEAAIARNSMTAPLGLELPDEPPVLHFSRLQNVLIWPLEPAAES